MTHSPERRRHGSRARACRAVLSIVSLLLAVAPIVASSSSPAVEASGTPNIARSESAPPTILYGTDASVSLAASNLSGGEWGYNLSYEDVLPAGVSYVSASTTPSRPSPAPCGTVVGPRTPWR